MFGILALPALLLFVFIAVSVAVLVAHVMFLLSMRGVLSQCAPEHRELGPNQVWLSFVPVFGIIWMYFLVAGVSRTLGRELRSRNVPSEEEPAKAAGLAWLIFSLFGFIPIFGWLAAIAGLICWIVYWVSISRRAAQLATVTGGGYAGYRS